MMGKPSRKALLAALAAVLAIGVSGVQSAAAAPILNLDVHHAETNFPPDGTGAPGAGKPEIWFSIGNVGDAPTSGPLSLVVVLPSGLTRSSVHLNGNSNTGANWSCPGSAGASTVTCTASDSIGAHNVDRRVVIAVNVAPVGPGAPADRTVVAKVSGGGASQAVNALESVHVSADPAGYGILPQSFLPGFFEEDGLTPVTASGSHPDLMTVPFDFHTVANPNSGAARQKSSAGSVRTVHADLPPGFLGDPTAVSECTQAEFAIEKCPPSSQVGQVHLRVFPIDSGEPETFSSMFQGAYNLIHPRGTVTDIAFAVVGNPIHIKASLDPSRNYAITTEVPNINETIPVFDQKLTVWGVPAEESHDSERCFAPDLGGVGNGPRPGDGCETDAPKIPFLTVPFECGIDHSFRLHSYDSWQEPGVFGPEIEYTLPQQTTGCEVPSFEPSVDLVPTGTQANTPTGLDVSIEVPQNKNPNARYTPPVKRTTVTLPEGMTLNPAFADGLDACTPGQIGLFTDSPVACPDNSRIGEVFLSTPLLPERLEGSLYLASQGSNPFQSTFALYMAIRDTEERGVLVKIPGRIDLDPVTGRITTSFDELPQFPFDEFTLRFRSGQRAPLVNPPACGSHEIEVEIASYAQPTKPLDASSSFEVSEGPGGGACIGDPARRPFSPRMAAGTLSPVAGSYSPFVFRMTRGDDEQELSAVTSTLPPGMVAKIAGISFCPDAAIASIPDAEGTGKAELAGPACPAASQIGTVSAGVGSGTSPNYFNGSVYLAGPYRGAPISLVTVAPALAGPYDLGNVVVRVPAYVDTETAQVKAISDPFPKILHGVLLRIRDVRLRIDRPETTINPTSCKPMSVEGKITGVGGDLFSGADDSLFDVSNPFQVGECGSLDFKPRLSLRLFGGTKRGAHPKLRATVRMPAGGANISSASVGLPRSAFLDQSHIGTVCTRVQFKVDQCPPASIYAEAEAKSPLLDEVLKGPVYLRSSDNPLPDLVAAFDSERIDVDLVGRIDSVNQGIRSTFDLVPDAPVSWAVFTFQGGKKGLLINSRDLCKKTYRATAKLTAHNGRRITLRPKMQNSCKKARKGAKRGRRSKAR